MLQSAVSSGSLPLRVTLPLICTVLTFTGMSPGCRRCRRPSWRSRSPLGHSPSQGTAGRTGRADRSSSSPGRPGATTRRSRWPRCDRSAGRFIGTAAEAGGALILAAAVDIAALAVATHDAAGTADDRAPARAGRRLLLADLHLTAATASRPDGTAAGRLVLGQILQTLLSGRRAGRHQPTAQRPTRQFAALLDSFPWISRC